MISKGTAINFSSGEYSDYQIRVSAIALADLDLSLLKSEYLNHHPNENQIYRASFDRFINWLTNEKKVIEDFPVIEIWLGAYDTLTPETR